MTEQELKEIEERAAKATAGPWGIKYQENNEDWLVMHGDDCVSEVMDWNAMPGNNNAQFIAHAREDVPRLIATLREMEQKIRGYEIAADIAEEQLSVRESTVAGLRAELDSEIKTGRETAIKCLELMAVLNQIKNKQMETDKTKDCLFAEVICLASYALSPSPSANSGEKPGITEQELKDRGYVDLTKLGGNDWRLQRYGECAACGGNLTADHQCHRRKSVSPGGIA